MADSHDGEYWDLDEARWVACAAPAAVVPAQGDPASVERLDAEVVAPPTS